jgi:pseudomonalisin/xanthomonalisin
MKYGSTLKMLPIAALVLAAYGNTAQAATTWVATESHAVDVSNAVAGPMMKDGESIYVAVSLRVRNKAGLDAKTESVVLGHSAPMTSTEFLTQYAPSKAQVDAVVAHLKSSGFVNVQVADNRLLVTADGTSGAAKSAFNVDLQHFNVNGRDAHAAVNDPVVPKELGDIILAVHGLQTVHQVHPFKVSANKVSATSGSEVGHSPAAWPTIYNAGSIPTASGTTIGIITAGPLTQTLKDLATFVKNAGFASPSTSTVSVGSGSVSSSGATEWDIDSQDSLGAAGGAVKSMIFYNAPSLSDANLTAEFNSATSANTAKVINVSLGECESDAKSDGSEASDDQIFETATAQGQVFAVAAGDSGSYECGGSKSNQSYPAVSPYVIAVGGTTVYTTSAGAWSSETVWSCTSSRSCANSGGTGGGVSSTETAPSWQKSSGVLGTSTARGVPDIAFDGNPSSGVLAIVDGASQQWGGTSLATPIFVGFWARIQSAHANGLVYPATALYKFGAANESTIFHDITSGSNGGYSAKAGWDYTTGFGSLNVGPFATFVTNNSGF